jgi:hypothetical protein
VFYSKIECAGTALLFYKRGLRPIYLSKGQRVKVTNGINPWGNALRNQSLSAVAPAYIAVIGTRSRYQASEVLLRRTPPVTVVANAVEWTNEVTIPSRKTCETTAVSSAYIRLFQWAVPASFIFPPALPQALLDLKVVNVLHSPSGRICQPLGLIFLATISSVVGVVDSAVVIPLHCIPVIQFAISSAIISIIVIITPSPVFRSIHSFASYLRYYCAISISRYVQVNVLPYCYQSLHLVMELY